MLYLEDREGEENKTNPNLESEVLLGIDLCIEDRNLRVDDVATFFVVEKEVVRSR